MSAAPSLRHLLLSAATAALAATAGCADDPFGPGNLPPNVSIDVGPAAEDLTPTPSKRGPKPEITPR